MSPTLPRYFDDYFGPSLRRSFTDTMQMGLLTATAGTLVGFIFAYAIVRCRIPGKRFVHWLALLPTVSPPFALDKHDLVVWTQRFDHA